MAFLEYGRNDGIGSRNAFDVFRHPHDAWSKDLNPVEWGRSKKVLRAMLDEQCLGGNLSCGSIIESLLHSSDSTIMKLLQSFCIQIPGSEPPKLIVCFIAKEENQFDAPSTKSSTPKSGDLDIEEDNGLVLDLSMSSPDPSPYCTDLASVHPNR